MSPWSRRHTLKSLGATLAAACAPAPVRHPPGRRPADTGSTPAGLRLPAEWEPHERTLMCFPTPQNWAGCWSGRCDWVDLARREWADVARAVASFEPVLMVANAGEGGMARELCGDDPAIEIIELPLNDAWARDTAPLFTLGADGLAA